MKEERLVPELRFSEFKDNLRLLTFADIGFFYYGKSAPKSTISPDGTTLCVRYGELYSTYTGVINQVVSKTTMLPNELKMSKGGEVLIPRVGEDPLDFSLASYLPHTNVAIGEMISVFNTNENGYFLVGYIRGKLKKIFAEKVEGASVSNLYYRYLEPIPLNLPSLPEQQKIADFLTSIDRKIQGLNRKVELLKAYKKGAMQRIFKQKIRFRDKDGVEFPEWEKIKLDQIFDKVSDKGSHDLPLYSVTLNDGLQPRESLERLVHNESDNAANLIVRKDDIAYNMMRMWQGAFGIAYQDCVVSPAYVIVRAKNKVCINFFKYLFDTSLSTYKFWSYSYGLTSDRLRLYPKDFLSIKFSIPNYQEQTKITSFLTSIDDKISVVEEKLQMMKEWKKGILQKMFV